MTEDSNGTKTIVGVGVAALLASATPPRALRTVEVAGTIDCERSFADDVSHSRRSRRTSATAS